MKILILRLVAFTILSLFCATAFSRTQTVSFYDADMNEPVAGVSVIGNTGMIIGVSDAQGRINVEEKDFPLHATCIGYEPATVPSERGMVELVPATYSLSEVVIGSAERPITRVLAYAREYSSGATASDTLQLFSEYMLEFFLAGDKVKGYHKSDRDANILAERSVARITGKNGVDSIFHPKKGDDIKALSFIRLVSRIPRETVTEREAIRNGATSDTIAGKYYPEYIFRKAGNTYTVKRDLLSDHEGHTWSPWFFKMLGMTMKMNDVSLTSGYLRNEAGAYEVSDLLYTTANLNVLAEGKIFKFLFKSNQSILLDSYTEQYPVAIEYLTIEEYNALRKEKDRTEEFEIPGTVTPLPTAILRLLQE